MATLQEKLAGLEAQFKNLADNANAVSGAIQFCKQLIAEENAVVPAAPLGGIEVLQKMIDDAVVYDAEQAEVKE